MLIMPSIKSHIPNFRNLAVYKDTLHFSVETYNLTTKFSENHGVIAHKLRRNAICLLTSLSEGNSSIYWKTELYHYNLLVQKVSASMAMLDLLTEIACLDADTVKSLHSEGEKIKRIISKLMMNAKKHSLNDDCDGINEIHPTDEHLILFNKESINETFQLSLNFESRIKTELESFPSSERGNIIDQLSRASNSVTMSLKALTENEQSLSLKEIVQKLSTASGSAGECASLLDASLMLKMLKHDTHHELDSISTKIRSQLADFIEQTTFKKENHHAIFSL